MCAGYNDRRNHARRHAGKETIAVGTSRVSFEDVEDMGVPYTSSGGSQAKSGFVNSAMPRKAQQTKPSTCTRAYTTKSTNSVGRAGK